MSNETEDVQDQSEPRSQDTSGTSEWNLLQGVSLSLPCRPEPDVAETDRTPSEEGGESRERKQPVEDGATAWGNVDVGEESKDEGEKESGEGSSHSVDVGKERRSLADLGKTSDGSR